MIHNKELGNEVNLVPQVINFDRLIMMLVYFITTTQGLQINILMKLNRTQSYIVKDQTLNSIRNTV